MGRNFQISFVIDYSYSWGYHYGLFYFYHHETTDEWFAMQIKGIEAISKCSLLEQQL